MAHPFLEPTAAIPEPPRSTARPARWLALVVALGSTACATVPTEPAEEALYVDLRRVVETRERAGWLIDRVELDDATPFALQSVCQVEPATRHALDGWLTEQIALAGGTSYDVWHQSGRDLGAADDILTLERVRALLRAADGAAASDCPFWLEPDPEFAGVQSSTDRFVLLLESRGGGDLLVGAGDVAYGGGGGGRLLLGYGLSSVATLTAGVELGGGGAVTENEGQQSVDATFRGAAPVLLRFTDVSRLYDIELAATVVFTPDRLVAAPGVRLNFGTGLATDRIGPFMPTAVLTAGYAYHPPALGLPSFHIFSVGTRVGVDVDP